MAFTDFFVVVGGKSCNKIKNINETQMVNAIVIKDFNSNSTANLAHYFQSAGQALFGCTVYLEFSLESHGF